MTDKKLDRKTKKFYEGHYDSKILKEIEKWNCDIISLDICVPPLVYMAMAYFKKFNLINTLNINEKKLLNFLFHIDKTYGDNPYHNSNHAADVLLATNYFISKCGIHDYFTKLEIFSALLAAILHDYDHSGKTNKYHISIQDERALRYNDRSVLESHHASLGFQIINQTEYNFLEHLTREDYTEVRKIIIELILCTDHALHFSVMDHFKSMQKREFNKNANTHRLLVLELAIKCADVCHTAKLPELHQFWTEKCMEEFYQQGDEEEKHGIPISPFMDRKKTSVPQAQMAFIDFLIIPLYETWVSFLGGMPATRIFFKQLITNRNYWRDQIPNVRKVPTKRVSYMTYIFGPNISIDEDEDS